MPNTIQCPSCKHEFTSTSETDSPFRDLDRFFEKTHLVDTLAEKGGRHEPLPKAGCCSASTRRIYHLVQLMGGDLPPFDELPYLPDLINDYINHANINVLKHIIIQSVGRWDTIAEGISEEESAGK